MLRAIAYLLACAGGAAAWVVASRISGEAEAWDDQLYFEAALPALGAFVALLGFGMKERVGALGIAASVGQIAGLAATRGEHEMWPVDLALLSVQAIPFGICAWLGSVGRRLLGGAFRVAGRTARFCSWPVRRMCRGRCRARGRDRGRDRDRATPPALPEDRAARRMLI